MTIEEIVRHYVETRSSRIVYTQSAIRSIKAFMPVCPLDDRQLAELVARHAISQGCAVTFEEAPLEDLSEAAESG